MDSRSNKARMGSSGSSDPEGLSNRDVFYTHLLWLCLGVLVFASFPPAVAHFSWMGYPLLFLQLVVGLSQRPGWRDPWGKRAYQVLGVACVVAQVVWVFRPRSLLSTALPLLALLLLFTGWSLVRLLRRLGRESPDQADLVAGGLAGYLLLGISGSLMLLVIDRLIPGCFRDAVTGSPLELPPSGSALEGTSLWDLDVQRIFYFAFSSLTTVGYGDIAPVKPIAQMASISLSILGPLYIAVVLGVVVSRVMTANLPPRE